MMLSAFKRIKLALVLMPAFLFPLLWIAALLVAPYQDIAWSVFTVIATAFVAAYSIASFIEYLRVLRGKQ